MIIGQVVISKNGRDKSRLFIVLRVEDDYIYLSDGKNRLIGKPKKKKIKHVQCTNTVIDLSETGNRGLQDSDIRKWLLPFQNKEV